MTYAPVVIHTLNRFEHFKRGIESLKANKYAEFTDLYISVDYPPAEKYEEGNKKIIEYLKNEEDNLKCSFNNVYIFVQESNLGARLNAVFLRDMVKNDGRYEAYIFAEDDLEFSPCFLEYMNKGLELFRDDDNVRAIVAMAPAGIDENLPYTTYKTIRSSAWGVGRWFAKEKVFWERFNRQFFENISKDYKLMYRLFRLSPYVFGSFYNTLLWKGSTYVLPDGSPRSIDFNRYIYNVVYGKYVMRPHVNMVRNWGLDGSGLNSGNSGVSACEQALYEGTAFEFNVAPDIVNLSENNISLKEYLDFVRKLLQITLFNIIGEKAYKCIDIDMFGAKINHKIYKLRSLFKRNK